MNLLYFPYFFNFSNIFISLCFVYRRLAVTHPRAHPHTNSMHTKTKCSHNDELSGRGTTQAITMVAGKGSKKRNMQATWVCLVFRFTILIFFMPIFRMLYTLNKAQRPILWLDCTCMAWNNTQIREKKTPDQSFTYGKTQTHLELATLSRD